SALSWWCFPRWWTSPWTRTWSARRRWRRFTLGALQGSCYIGRERSVRGLEIPVVRKFLNCSPCCVVQRTRRLNLESRLQGADLTSLEVVFEVIPTAIRAWLLL